MTPCQMIHRFLGLCLLIWVQLTECNLIHEEMTVDEVFNTFHTSRSHVPFYKIVTLRHHFEKTFRATRLHLKFEAFRHEINIYLYPTDGVLADEETPVWIAKEYFGRVLYRKLKRKIMSEVIGVYESLPDDTTLVVRRRRDNSWTFDGTIGELAIKPVPDRLQNLMDERDKVKRHLQSNTSSNVITERHIIFKLNKEINESNTTQQSDEATVHNIQAFSKQINVERSKRADESVLYPSILVVTDFNTTKNSNTDIGYYDEIIYQLAFWNAVDLKFRHLTNPRVRLRIAGIVIGSDRKSTPYLYDHTLNGEVEHQSALEDMSTFWYEKFIDGYFSNGSFDIAVTATNLRIIGILDSGVKKTYVGAAMRTLSFSCGQSSKKFHPMVIFNDDRSFTRINTAVHELAHVFGAVHDSDTNKNCTPNHGYLMSPSESVTSNSPKWSKCSLDDMEKFLRRVNCTGMAKHYYRPGKRLRKILPGTVRTAEQQCQARGFDHACSPTPEICQSLKCWNSGFVNLFKTGWMCKSSQSAAEGTVCAPNGVCLNGECLFL